MLEWIVKSKMNIKDYEDILMKYELFWVKKFILVYILFVIFIVGIIGNIIFFFILWRNMFWIFIYFYLVIFVIVDLVVL